jgi:hypothetical protein
LALQDGPELEAVGCVPVDQTRGLETGPLYGSVFWLWLITASGAMAVFVLLALPSSINGSIVPGLVGIALGMGVMSAILRRMTTVTVDAEGLRLSSSAWEVIVRWEDVAAFEPHLLSGKVVLKEPTRLGLITRRKLPFAALDPQWRTRPTSRLILLRLEGKTSS